MKTSSIRIRTLSWVLLVFVLASGLLAWSSFHDAAHEVEELYDAHLAQQARLISSLLTGMEATSLTQVAKLRLLNTMEQTTLQAGDNKGHKYESKVVFQVWQRDQLLLRSRNAPAGRLSQEGEGYSNTQLGNHLWRVFALSLAETGHTILIAERDDVRGELVDKIALRTLLPDILGTPFLLLLIWWAVGRGLKPLHQLAQLLHERDPQSLEPLQLKPLPRELETIQKAINLLMQQLRELLAREKRFIADAAHELRTPLSVLSLHTQNALHAQTSAEQQDSLQALETGIARTTRIISQLLTLARLEPESGDHKSWQDPLPISRQVLADLAPLAWKEGIELQLVDDLPARGQLLLETGSLEILLQNLISNSIKQAPEDSEITLRWQLQGGELLLEVIDAGPGVADEDKPRLWERFYRKGQYTGSGLGMAIVARIAARHQARLVLTDTPGGGLTVQLFWPEKGFHQVEEKTVIPSGRPLSEDKS
ncbi:ATP-binding protein [Marinospirillum perlucidum]|uniref:ATP-binding protein n=1 Tax=Marinospirillum perlucidum TaxID=1982602 RepID=UPI000DF40FE8|nr:ATP-binding protein [Marinospirillum perlucidum]